MEDVTHNYKYPLSNPTRSAAVDAARNRTALEMIDLNMASALAPATTMSPGRVLVAKPGDIAKGQREVFPDAADIKHYVAEAVASLIATSASTLESLEKLREAIGNDPDFATTILTRLETKADLSLVVNQTVPVGAEMSFTGMVPPPGWLMETGVLLPRVDIPRLTEFALASGNIVTEEEWLAGRFGSYSYGPGGINGEFLRIPDTRGTFDRALDLGAGRDPDRQIGSLQQSQNLRHKHGGRTARSGRHVHSAWTDTQGWHDHWNPCGYEGGQCGIGGGTMQSNYTGRIMIWDHRGYATGGNGNHAHNVGIGEAGEHDHTFETDETGGNEARPLNVARMKILKY